MLKEFKNFAIRGNVVDLAVAVIIGNAFSKIVSSLVESIIMPLIGVFLGGVNFSELTYTIGEAIIGYGVFIQSIFDFVIISFSIFMVVKFINRFKQNDPAADKKELPAPSPTETYLKEIRDLLAKK